MSQIRMPIPISKFKEHVAKMHLDGDQGFELEYNVCGMLSMEVCAVEKFLSCCSPSINNPRPHIVLLISLAIVFKTDSEISSLVSGEQLCYGN